MNKSFKPMLAYGLEESDLPNLKYPLIIQPKLDGIRCCIVEGKAVSRKLKPIPNRFIRDTLERYNKLSYLIDGELIVKGKTFNDIQSDVMTENGAPNFTYVVFDCINAFADERFEHRQINNLPLIKYMDRVEFLNSTTIHNYEELLEWETYILKDGNEGIILRSPTQPYKFGRSTLREQSLMKFKRFKDSEAQILLSEPLLSNCNTLESDNLGYAKRSSFKSNLVAENKLGSWYVVDCNPESEFYKVEFHIGTGFTELQRVRFWELKDLYIGKIIKYKYTPFGAKDKPRSPVWLGMRED